MMTRRFGHVDVMTNSNVRCKQTCPTALCAERLPSTTNAFNGSSHELRCVALGSQLNIQSI